MIDYHAHTTLSYCADSNMTVDQYYQKLKTSTDVDKITLSDHGMAIYFPPKTAWKWEFVSDSSIFDKHKDWGNERLEKYINIITDKKSKNAGIIPGIEVEMMHDNRLTLDPDYSKYFDIIIGSVHYLPINKENGYSLEEINSFWKNHVLQLLNTGIHILGHPFRWLYKESTVSKDMIAEIIDEAVKNDVAIELNSHYHIPTDETMLKIALAKNAKIAFGTDSHRVDEIGNFSYHFNILKKAGIQLNDLNIYNPFTKKRKV